MTARVDRELPGPWTVTRVAPQHVARFEWSDYGVRVVLLESGGACILVPEEARQLHAWLGAVLAQLVLTGALHD